MRRIESRLHAIIIVVAVLAGLAEAASPTNGREYWICRKHAAVVADGVWGDTVASITTGGAVKLPATQAGLTTLTSTIDLGNITAPTVLLRLLYKSRPDSGAHTALLFAAFPWDTLKRLPVPVHRYATYADSISGGWWGAELALSRGDFAVYGRVIVDNWKRATVDSPRVVMSTVNAPAPRGSGHGGQRVMYRVVLWDNITIAGGAAARLDSGAVCNTRFAWAPKPDYYVLRFSASAPHATSADSSYFVTAKFQDAGRNTAFHVGEDSVRMRLNFQGANKIAGEIRTVTYCGNTLRTRTVNMRPAGKSMTRGRFEAWAIRREE